MHDLVTQILSGARKSWFKTRPLFDACKPVVPSEIERIETKIDAALPEDSKLWLLPAGDGDIGEVLSFRHDGFNQIQQGHPTSHRSG